MNVLYSWVEARQPRVSVRTDQLVSGAPTTSSSFVKWMGTAEGSQSDVSCVAADMATAERIET